MSLWIVDGGMVELPVVARVEDWEEGSYIEITGSDDGAEWNDAPIRYVAERTCHCKTLDEAWCFACSLCGKSFPRHELHLAYNHGEINYCPNCGAKVVE